MVPFATVPMPAPPILWLALAGVLLLLELVGADGVVKESRSQDVPALCRFKMVVDEFFTGSTVMAGDYVRYTATGPVLAIQVSGDDGRTVMSAINGAR